MVPQWTHYPPTTGRHHLWLGGDKVLFAEYRPNITADKYLLLKWRCLLEGHPEDHGDKPDHKVHFHQLADSFQLPAAGITGHLHQSI
jgi:hypothetical protein